jgi:hypothetical protein
MKIIAVDNKDQTSVLREQGDEHRHEHLLCRSPSIESDLVVALERGGLSPAAFANVNSYGANVVSLPWP